MRKLFILSILSLAIAESALLAATYTVPADYATIGAAISGAPEGSTIIVNSGIYTDYVAALDLSKNLYIKSQSGAAATILSGENTDTILRVENSASGDATKNIVFDGFTFSDGRGVTTISSPITIASASPNFINCVFKNNSSPEKGGAVLVYGSRAKPTFIDCEFSDNTSDATAGAVLVSGGHSQAIFKRCEFRNNSNRTAAAGFYNEGGALYFSLGGGKVIDSVFTGNSACYAGGAIMMLNWWDQTEDKVTISGCQFNNNYCLPVPGKEPPQPSEGGAIMIENNLEVEIRDCVFNGNTAAAGGAVHSYRGNMDIERCIFDGNTANGTNFLGYGGAIGVRLDDAGDADRREATINIKDTVIRNSIAPVGGAIFCDGDASYLHHCLLGLNNVTIDSNLSTTANNSYGNAGGIFLSRTLCAATNVYVLNNIAEGLGGAFVIVSDTVLTLADSAIVGNSAAVDDLIHDPDGSTYSLNNTLLAYNGGSPTHNGTLFSSVPDTTVDGIASLLYFVAPYDTNIVISPYVGLLSDQGGYAAGTVLVTGIVETTAFTLSSSHPNETNQILYSGSSIVDSSIKNAPGTIEAEDFSEGGEGVAYHDTTLPNEGGAYRTTDSVDIASDASAGNGYSVAWTKAGEWLEYSVNVTTSGFYRISIQVASSGGGGSLSLHEGGERFQAFSIPDTGGWTSWQSLTEENILLWKGLHTYRLMVEEGGFNLDSIVFDLTSTSPVIATDTTKTYRSVKAGNTNSAVSSIFHVSNAGIGSLIYSTSNTIPWLTVSPSNGTCTTESDALYLQYSSIGLATGTYSGTIAVTSTNATNTSVEIDITLIVTPAGSSPNDFDGDGRSDLGVYFPPQGKWYIFASTDGFYDDQFGYLGTKPITGDFDGDGKGDFGVYYAPLGKWYIFSSSTGFYQDQFGYDGTIPITGDFDGDGLGDFGCYHPPSGNWYLFQSTNGFYNTQFGFDGTIPVTGDFDGDGLCDFGYYHPSTGAWKLSKSTGGFIETAFGFAGTVPITGDFDADGIDDFGVYYDQEGKWYIFRSTRGYFEDRFGYAGTVPVVGDFDGDGTSDIGCYYAPGGNWYIFGSSTGFYQDQFGYSGTLPLGSTQTQP